MKKNYFLTLLVTLFMAVTASAADSLVGIYKLSNLTAEQTEALGGLPADAAIRILPGDEQAEYYVSGIAGYGCKFAATYDAAAGTLTVADQGPYGVMAMVLYFGDTNVVAIDGTSVVFNVKEDGTLSFDTEAIVTGMFTEEVYGTYIPGVTLAKDETPTASVSDVVGDYTFTGTAITNFFTYEIEEVKYTMSIQQGSDNVLTINGFMGVDGVQATYIPEVAMIQIATQEAGSVSVGQNYGDIYFTVSDDELALISPAVVAPLDDMMPLVSVIDGKAVKEDVIDVPVNLVGIYQLSNLTAEQTEALGGLPADAAIRIMPGDEQADYYVSGIAGYGCKFAATYDAAAGTLTVADQGPYGVMAMVLYFGDTNVVAIDGTSVVFNVKEDGTLSFDTEAIVTGMFTGEVYGTYIPGVTLAKDETPTASVSDVVGDYTFTGTAITNFFTYEIEEVKYTMSIQQGSDNVLTINGFMGVDGVQATYIPEVAMIQIATQEAGNVSVGQNYGDIYFTVSDGELALISPALVAPLDDIMPLVSVIDGKAVKGIENAIENIAATSAASVSVSNGAICINSAEPVAVQIYNVAGVQVYSDTVNGSITLPRGIYFVKVAGNSKAISVAL